MVGEVVGEEVGDVVDEVVDEEVNEEVVDEVNDVDKSGKGSLDIVTQCKRIPVGEQSGKATVNRQRHRNIF